MPVFIFGINHKTAPVSIREKVAFSPRVILESLVNIKNTLPLDEVVIVSTCNRMEVIYSSDSAIVDEQQSLVKFQEIMIWIANQHQLDPDEIKNSTYHHVGISAVEHIMKVACGLDSMVLGEPQILGQVKDAYAYARQADTTGFYLNRLFQQTFSLAKQVRTETQIGASAVSVAYAAATLAKRIFSDLSSVQALFIGAGETIELTARHLAQQGVSQMKVANRTIERAQHLVNEFGATAYGLSALPELVAQADIIISSTASSLPIIGKGLMEKAIKQRKHRSIFMVDLAVPRDVEPEVADLNDIYLYTVDDMQAIVKENVKIRHDAATAAQEIIYEHAQKYLAWLKSLSSVSLLKSFRQQIEEIKEEELKRAISKLKSENTTNNINFSEEILNEFSNRLTQKLMHSPSKIIREAGEKNQQQKIQWLAELFNLKKDN